MYVAMWSLPGCIPEMEPARFDNLDVALDFMWDELNIRENSEESEHTASEWYDMKMSLDDIAEASDLPWIETAPDGYVYTITRE